MQPVDTLPASVPLTTSLTVTASVSNTVTATQQSFPTLTVGPTRTPSPTSTRAPTYTPIVICRSGDTMTFDPAIPTPGELFIIEVRSLTGYVDVSLTGAPSPRFNGAKKDGSYYVWRWEESFDTAGTYTLRFSIQKGASTCITKAVTVAAPTNTPTPTPTVAPQYGLDLVFIGTDSLRPILTDTEPVIFELRLTNTGNVADSFEVWLDAAPPGGWSARYCIGDSCYTDPGTQVTLPAGGSQGLSIQLVAPPDAQVQDTLAATLWVRSLGDPAEEKNQRVAVEVTSPALSR